MMTTPNPRPTLAPRGFRIDSRVGVAATRAPAASNEDSHAQAILKSTAPVAWITEPAMDPRFFAYMWQRIFGKDKTSYLVPFLSL